MKHILYISLAVLFIECHSKPPLEYHVDMHWHNDVLVIDATPAIIFRFDSMVKTEWILNYGKTHEIRIWRHPPSIYELEEELDTAMYYGDIYDQYGAKIINSK